MAAINEDARPADRDQTNQQNGQEIKLNRQGDQPPAGDYNGNPSAMKPSAAFTPNYEADADIVAPILAATRGVTGALYLWLHSRVFREHNLIKVSHGFLAGILGIDVSSVKDALGVLSDKGLIEVSTKRGNGGGTWISLTHVGASQDLIGGFPTVKQGDSPLLNGAYSPYDIDSNSKEEKVLAENGSEIAEEIVTYLNRRCGRSGKPASRDEVQIVSERLAEGRSKDDLKLVVDGMCGFWQGTDKEKYLVPATLFDPSRFDSYLTQAEEHRSNHHG